MAYINVIEWSSERVCDWLKGLDDSMYNYVDAFTQHEIGGRQLLNIRPYVLEQFGINCIGHQEIILEAVESLRNFHYNLDKENLQFMALHVATAARSLHGQLATQCGATVIETQILSDITRTIATIKPLISWLERAPFRGQFQFTEICRKMLRLGLEMATIAQRERFVENPVEKIRSTAKTLELLANYIIQDITDPMLLQPASLDLVTLKKRESELGFNIESTYHGTFRITDIKHNSPAHNSGKIEDGDEIIQVNYQTVVGWQYKSVFYQLRESLPDVLLTLKKRPKHTKIYGQIYAQPYRLPSKKRSIGNRWGGENVPSPRPNPLTKSENNFKSGAPPAPLTLNGKNENDGKAEDADTDSISSDILTPTDSKATEKESRLYYPKPRAMLQRRNTICGDELFGHKGVSGISPLWHERKTVIGGVCDPASPSLRDKSISFGFGLEITPRPTTCIGISSSTTNPADNTNDAKGKVGSTGSSGLPTPNFLIANSNNPTLQPLQELDETFKPGVSKVVRFDANMKVLDYPVNEKYTCNVENTILETFEPIPFADEDDDVHQTIEDNIHNNISEAVTNYNRSNNKAKSDTDVALGNESYNDDGNTSSSVTFEAINTTLLSRRSRLDKSHSTPTYDNTNDDCHTPPPAVEPRKEFLLVTPPVPPPRPKKQHEQNNARIVIPIPPKPPGLMQSLTASVVVPAALEITTVTHSVRTPTTISTVVAMPTTAATSSTLGSPLSDDTLATPPNIRDYEINENNGSLRLGVDDVQTPLKIRSLTLKKKHNLIMKRRNVNLKLLGTGDIQGHLYRRTKDKRGVTFWARLYFLMLDTLLYGFRSKESAKARCVIFLPGFTVSLAKEVHSKPYAFKVYHTAKTFYFAAESQDALNQWMDFIRQATLTTATTAAISANRNGNTTIMFHVNNSNQLVHNYNTNSHTIVSNSSSNNSNASSGNISINNNDINTQDLFSENDDSSGEDSVNDSFINKNIWTPSSTIQSGNLNENIMNNVPGNSTPISTLKVISTTAATATAATSTTATTNSTRHDKKYLGSLRKLTKSTLHFKSSLTSSSCTSSPGTNEKEKKSSSSSSLSPFSNDMIPVPTEQFRSYRKVPGGSYGIQIGTNTPGYHDSTLLPISFFKAHIKDNQLQQQQQKQLQQQQQQQQQQQLCNNDNIPVTIVTTPTTQIHITSDLLLDQQQQQQLQHVENHECNSQELKANVEVVNTIDKPSNNSTNSTLIIPITTVTSTTPITHKQCAKAIVESVCSGSNRNIKKVPYNFIHASNPNLVEFDFQTSKTLDYALPKINSNTSWNMHTTIDSSGVTGVGIGSGGGVTGGSTQGFMTLKDLMLQKQEEEAQDMYNNRVLLGIEKKEDHRHRHNKNNGNNNINTSVNCANTLIMGGGLNSVQGRSNDTKVAKTQSRSLPKPPDYEISFKPDDVDIQLTRTKEGLKLRDFGYELISGDDPSENDSTGNNNLSYRQHNNNASSGTNVDQVEQNFNNNTSSSSNWTTAMKTRGFLLTSTKHKKSNVNNINSGSTADLIVANHHHSGSNNNANEKRLGSFKKKGKLESFKTSSERIFQFGKQSSCGGNSNVTSSGITMTLPLNKKSHHHHGNSNIDNGIGGGSGCGSTIKKSNTYNNDLKDKGGYKYEVQRKNSAPMPIFSKLSFAHGTSTFQATEKDGTGLHKLANKEKKLLGSPLLHRTVFGLHHQQHNANHHFVSTMSNTLGALPTPATSSGGIGGGNTQQQQQHPLTYMGREYDQEIFSQVIFPKVPSSSSRKYATQNAPTIITTATTTVATAETTTTQSTGHHRISIKAPEMNAPPPPPVLVPVSASPTSASATPIATTTTRTTLAQNSLFVTDKIQYKVKAIDYPQIGQCPSESKIKRNNNNNNNIASSDIG